MCWACGHQPHHPQNPAVELPLLDLLVGTGAGDDPAGGDGFGVGVRGDRRAVLRTRSRASTRAAAMRVAAFRGPKVVAVRGSTQPLVADHMIWLCAHDAAGTSANVTVAAWAGAAMHRNRSTPSANFAS